MNLRRVSAPCFAAVLALMLASPGLADYPVHEIWIGGGGASSSESSIFNVPSDLKFKPEAVFSLGYMHNYDERRAMGFHIYGASETTPDVALIGPSGLTTTTFDLYTYNFGVRYRQTFLRGGISPYAFVGASFASGSVESKATGGLNSSGFSVCLGPGAAVALGRSFMLSADLFGSFGSAKWKEKPFANSTSDKFDPSLIGGTLNISFVWGSNQ